MIEAQPHQGKFKPFQWEDLKASHKNEEAKDSTKGMDNKKLPSHHEYVFLVEVHKFPTIIRANLSKSEEEKRLQVLKQHKMEI